MIRLIRQIRVLKTNFATKHLRLTFIELESICVNRNFLLGDKNMTAKEHNKLLGIFLLVHGGIQAFVMLILALVYGVIGIGLTATARRSEDQFVGIFFLLAILFIAIFSLILVVPQLIGGWKVLKEKNNARTWGIVGSIVALLSFPLGTAAGVYGLWFLFGEEGKRFYLGGGNQPQMFNAPPPNNWR